MNWKLISHDFKSLNEIYFSIVALSVLHNVAVLANKHAVKYSTYSIEAYIMLVHIDKHLVIVILPILGNTYTLYIPAIHVPHIIMIVSRTGAYILL